MKKFIKSFAILFLSTLFFASTVYAANIIRYDGQGIRGIQSVQSWSTNSRKRYTVHHNQTPNPGSQNVRFKVSVVTRSWIGGAEHASSIFYGRSSGSFSVDLNPGTYGLYFNTISRGSYDIWGEVTSP